MMSNVSKLQSLILFALSLVSLWYLQPVVASAKAIDDAVVILTFDKADMKLQGGKPEQVLDVSGNNNHGLVNGKGGKVSEETRPKSSKDSTETPCDFQEVIGLKSLIPIPLASPRH